MKRTGHAVLPLHRGRAPEWLTSRMKKLSDSMVSLIVEEYGQAEFLKRLSDPLWFQAFGCVLGFDWHSSGLTTVVTGVLKDAVKIDKHGVAAVGGKGGASKRAPDELEELGKKLHLTNQKVEELKYSSKMAAKVDNTAIQDGYNIYHHVFFVSEKGEWCVVQQGMNVQDKLARRYHWLSEKVRSFVEEPHSGIVGWTLRAKVLDMTSTDSAESRKVCVDLVKDSPSSLISSIKRLTSKHPTLELWTESARSPSRYVAFEMPRRLDWEVFHKLYDLQPKNYEELLAFKGVGPSTVRALALVAELVYGAPPSWKDPVKFTFAHGGKDGKPFPVRKEVMDETIRILKGVIEAVDVERNERILALKRLEGLAHRWGL